MKLTAGAGLLAVAAVAVVAAIVAGIMVLGPPSGERARRLDQKRVSDLQQLSSAIDYYQQQNGRLPSSLNDLASLPNIRVELRDPVSGQPYGFHAVGTTSYDVCATFDRDSEDGRGRNAEFWAHTPGTHCFTKKVPTRQQ